MNFTRDWLLAIYLYADKNDGQVPESFEQALPFLPEHTAGESGDPRSDARLAAQLTTDRYEIVYGGALTNISNPAAAIILREKEAWPGANGGWNRAYGFADGHSEIHGAADGNFEPWERGRMALSPRAALPGGVQ